MRYLAVFLCALLSSCGWIPEKPVTPVRTIVSEPTGPARELVVLLPGRWSEPEEFAAEGFTDLVRARHPQARIVAPDLHVGYYMAGMAADRIEQEIIAPARRTGVKRITLVGISMGGLGALMHAAEYPQSADQLVLLSPFAGEEEVIDEIAAAGGLARWQVAEPLAPRDYSRRLWRHFQKQPPTGIRLGCGESDRLAPTSRLIAAELLDRNDALWLPGDHDWPTWNELYRQLSAR
ncbi:MAG: alpha/beta fold hydrolase [Akkermansiaceae bacterium]|nr:alpha/beta fold hydrolase [Akkermansiaceae bacterium]